MALMLLAINQLQSLEHDQNRHKIKRIRFQLRNHSDVFSQTSETEFIKLFRLSKSIAKRFIQLIKPYMRQRQQLWGLPRTLKILATLRFLATGSYQRPVGQDFFLGFSQTSISRSIHEVCDVINNHLAAQFVRFPDVLEQTTIKQEFYKKHKMPGVIGVIDGTHISILRPSIDVEHIYYSTRKSAHTKNVQIICDHKLQILNVNARFGGSAHDSFVWNNSVVKKQLRDEYIKGQRDTWLLGDSGYGLQPWLMTPISNSQNSQEDMIIMYLIKKRDIS